MLICWVKSYICTYSSNYTLRILIIVRANGYWICGVGRDDQGLCPWTPSGRSPLNPPRVLSVLQRIAPLSQLYLPVRAVLVSYGAPRHYSRILVFYERYLCVEGGKSATNLLQKKGIILTCRP